MNINWFPGHMVKTKKEISASIKLVDAVIEMRDARIVISSKNPEIDYLCKDKPRIILLNKCDLAEESITKKWSEILSSDNVSVLSINCNTGFGLNYIKPTLNNLLKSKHEKLKSKGIKNIIDRVMVVGIPNVGKSSLINKIARSKIAKTGNRPGVTKSKQWIKTKIGIELMDTPGILWPKLESKEVQLNLAFTGAIKDEVMDIEELALNLIEVLSKNYGDRIIKRYKLDSLSENAIENIDNIARKRGAIMRGGEIDYNRVSNIILDEYRSGKLGNISLEIPN
ncbi:ribosome biogenesis GTPase YlqF [Clostridium sp. LBM24168]